VAVRCGDPEPVARALGLRTVLPANWASGLTEVESAGVFVTPVVDGWVLAVGRDLARIAHEPARIEAMLTLLGETFGAACWFATDEQAEFHGWARAERRELVRGYAFAGDDGHAWWHGDITEHEHRLNCFVDDPRDQSDDEVKWWPDRRTVLALAGAWSVDPSRLADRDLPAGVGCVGRL